MPVAREPRDQRHAGDRAGRRSRGSGGGVPRPQRGVDRRRRSRRASRIDAIERDRDPPARRAAPAGSTRTAAGADPTTAPAPTSRSSSSSIDVVAAGARDAEQRTALRQVLERAVHRCHGVARVNHAHRAVPATGTRALRRRSSSIHQSFPIPTSTRRPARRRIRASQVGSHGESTDIGVNRVGGNETAEAQRSRFAISR